MLNLLKDIKNTQWTVYIDKVCLGGILIERDFK